MKEKENKHPTPIIIPPGEKDIHKNAYLFFVYRKMDQTLILYGVVILLVAYVGILCYIKVQSPFWFHQPVYHTTMLYPKTFGYWSKPYLSKPLSRMRPNMYCDFYHIHTQPYSDLSPDLKRRITKLIQAHYLDHESFLYDINARVLDTYYTGQKHQSFVSFYKREKLEEHRDTTKVHPFSLKVRFEKNPLACIFTSQQYIWFTAWKENPRDSNQSFHFPIYMWDFVCTHRDYKSQMISRKMIQTHIYNTMKALQTQVQAGIFKKEVVLCPGVIPLVQYTTYTFFIQRTPISKLPIGYKIKRIEPRTMNAWVELYTQLPQATAIFDVVVMPSLNNTITAIESETHYVILLVCTLGGRETVKGVYIFKDTYTVWDQETLSQNRTIQCVSSVCYDFTQSLIFFRGFVHSIKELYYQKKDYGVLSIEHNSHNGLLLKRWQEKYSMHMATPTAYYLYNLIYPKSTLKSERFFVF